MWTFYSLLAVNFCTVINGVTDLVLVGVPRAVAVVPADCLRAEMDRAN